MTLSIYVKGLLVGEQEIAQYRARAQAAQARNPQGGKVQQYLDQLESELQDTEGMIVSLAQTVESEIGSAMSNAITGLIDGTQTAEEAFANMFKNIGKAFIDMATKMIAKALVMKALGILGGGGGGLGGGGPLGSGVGSLLGGSFAGGGSTGDGPRSGGLDGRGGYMAMVHPQETVVDHYGAMSRYSPGGGGGGAGGSVSANVTYNGPTLNFNGDDYIPRSEASKLVAAGAKAGKAQTMRTLQNSRSQRSKLGMA